MSNVGSGLTSVEIVDMDAGSELVFMAIGGRARL
jgi:hypothetical protein